MGESSFRPFGADRRRGCLGLTRQRKKSQPRLTSELVDGVGAKQGSNGGIVMGDIFYGSLG